jgi:hypothetical protein
MIQLEVITFTINLSYNLSLTKTERIKGPKHVPNVIFLLWAFKAILRTIKTLLSGGCRSPMHCTCRVRSPSNEIAPN